MENTKTDVVLDAQAVMLIEEHVRRLLAMMGFTEATVRCQVSPQTLSIDIEAGDDGRLLIGAQGAHLAAFQHVIRCVLRGQIKEQIRILVDVNNYRLRREQVVIGLAQEAARKAQRTGRTIAMAPMSAADRRAVHAALANQKDIRTESLGEEPDRRVVIRPVFL